MESPKLDIHDLHFGERINIVTYKKTFLVIVSQILRSIFTFNLILSGESETLQDTAGGYP